MYEALATYLLPHLPFQPPLPTLSLHTSRSLHTKLFPISSHTMLAPPSGTFQIIWNFSLENSCYLQSNVTSFVKTSPPSTQCMLLLWYLSRYSYFFICLLPSWTESLECRDHISLCFVYWPLTLYLVHSKPALNVQWEADRITEWINNWLWYESE